MGRALHHLGSLRSRSETASPNYGIDQRDIAEYFPLETTVAGMLDMVQGYSALSSKNGKRAKRSPYGMIPCVFSAPGTTKAKNECRRFLGYLFLGPLDPRLRGETRGVNPLNLMPVGALRMLSLPIGHTA